MSFAAGRDAKYVREVAGKGSGREGPMTDYTCGEAGRHATSGVRVLLLPSEVSSTASIILQLGW